ncbi:MAG: very short patch repair endonuclease [Pannonibacter sp.]
MDVDAVRSHIMRSVGRANTKPEHVVRRTLHSLGLRFRLPRKDLPGTPDIVLPRFKTVIFVHGCFWHRHAGCSKASTPKTRVEFWSAKFEQNVARDHKNEAMLKKRGWTALTVWECETRRPIELKATLAALFGRLME